MKRFITADEAISLLPDKNEIHTFINNPSPIALVGADWSREDLIEKLRNADKIEIAGAQARSMDHGLAVYDDSAMYQSDILFVETDKDKLDKFDKPGKESEEEE